MTNRKWIFIFLSILLLSLVGMYAVRIFPSTQAIAVVQVSGKEVRRIDLSAVTEPYTFEVMGKDGRNTISVAPGSISVIDADCPDRLCVKHGPLKNRFSPIVCLPNELTVTLEQKSGKIDAVSR